MNPAPRTRSSPQAGRGFSSVSLAWAGALCASLAPAAAGRADTAATNALVLHSGDASAGAGKADSERCSECHSRDPSRSGPDDGTGARFPRLTGQDAAYLQKQLMDFREGRRRHDFMQMMARSVDDTDLADIVAYFAQLPAMRGDGGGKDAAASQLFAQGDAQRGIAACSHCHGGGATARRDGIPLLAGQDSRYLQQQLAAWRNGERHNDADGGMNTVARALNDGDIERLAAFLAGQ